MEQQYKTDAEIYAVLEREIIDLTVRPGSALSENPLCTRFGAPRSMIRVVLQKLQENGKIDHSLIFYSDMGIYKLLMGIEDREIIQEYYDKSIRPLLDYDEKNDSDLAAVLRAYLNHNGSVKETADELYVHRNTINYKLTRISEILDMDLSQLNTRLQLSVGFMLEDMLWSP